MTRSYDVCYPGDVVYLKNDSSTYGILLSQSKANFMTLSSSVHSEHIAKSTCDIYYILLSSFEVLGPFYRDEFELVSERHVS